MKTNKIISQHRRDFIAQYECEGCGTTKTASGYDDAYFHGNVIPQMKCSSCGKSSDDLGVDYRPLTTKYAAGVVV